MKKKNLLLLSICLLFALNSFGQVIPNKDWVQQVSNGGVDIQGFAAAVDYTSGAVYSCGYMNTVSNGKDVVVVKLDSNGVQQWSASYNYSTANLDDRANAICVDPSGNVYIAGSSQASSTNSDIILIKYNSSGVQQWVTRFAGNAGSNDEATGIGVDNSGNVYFVGYLTQNSKGKDFTIGKVNSSGVTQGSIRLNGTASVDDMAESLVIDGSNLFATGSINQTSNGKDILTVCVAMSGLSLTWSVTVNGSSNADDSGYDITTYSTSIYVCGKTSNSTTNEDYYFAKMNQSDGSITYSNTYDGGYNGSDCATSIVSDKQGNFGITGLVTNGSGKEYHTQMYGASSLAWTHVQPQNGSFTNANPKIACDTLADHYYVSGVYFNGTRDGMLYQVDPTGVKRWTKYHNGTGGARDAFVDLVVDGLGRIFVASADETSTSSNSYDYNIIRFSQTPVYMPVNYNMLADTFSMAHLFYPNTTQVLDTTGTFVNTVSFYTEFAYPKEFIERNRVMFAERDSNTTSRVDMYFDGANEYGEIFGVDHQNNAVLNYFLNYTGSNGTTNVKGASHLIFPNIYPMIDLHYSSNGNGAKYYFVVKPTGDPNIIRIRFDGAASTATVSNDLVITSAISSWTFKQPDCYNVSVPSFTNLSITTTTTSGSRWVSLGSDTYSIDPGTYNSAWPLVIEFDKGKFSAPSSIDNINWSTYYGRSGADWIFDTKCDAGNNLYICGSSDSPNLPGSAGSYQSSNSSNQNRSDGFVAKFSPSGVLRWATFVGGSDNLETLSSFDFDPSGTDIYCVGYTGSTNLITIPKSGAINNSSFNTGSGTDAMIFQIDSAGKIPKWLTYWGGNNLDYAMKCKFDKNKNFVIVGASASSNITPYGSSPTYTANYSDLYSGTDGFILKLDSVTHNNKWFTYVGSSASTFSFAPCTDDWFLDIDFNSNNEMFVVGSASGSNYPTVGTGTFGLASACENDGIISKISNSGQFIWSSYYGSTDPDVIHSVKTFTNGDVYFAGQTASAPGFPTLSSSKFFYDGAKATIPGAPNAGFFINYDNSMVLQHATVIGGDGSDVIFDMELDAAGGIYLLGKTTSSAITTPFGGNPANTYNSVSTTGSYDYLIYHLQPNNTDVVWACMVGGNNQEGAGIRRTVNGTIDGNNRLFIAGTSQSYTNFPVDNGGGGAVYFQPTISGGYDGTITRFNLSPANGIGISEYKKDMGEVYVYPNPASNSLNIKTNRVKGQQTYRVYNNLGQIVLFGNLENSGRINISSLTEGMYILELSNTESKGTTKFVKYD